MEYRYYITTGIAILVLQCLVFNFSRTLGWLFNLSTKSRKIVTFISYLAANGLAILTVTRTFNGFRITALMLALLLFALFVSLACVVIYRLFKGKQAVNFALKITYPFAFFGIVGLALYNAYTPKVVHYSVQLDKPLAQPLRIGVASDLHLGQWFGSKQLDKLAEIFNQQNVDLILLPGDIMDDNTDAYVAENMQPHLAKLKAPLGVYATLGNHDFFGKQQAIAAEIQKAGIQVLWDQAVEINGKFTIIGRNDDLVKNRPSAAQLLTAVNSDLPVFLLDHRPTQIEQHSQLPIDLQVSGHTHKGQIFPANLMTNVIYRLHYGYEKIGLGHYFVTSGYGFWGIPMRLGSQSEVFIIDVKGK
ncbi:metallophosphoesterase [Actinobacillus equuli subsp. haemolyticus]|uniref:metallophosphoesterase n=1 Tax=Actinobacillus equuli TaxID=718 RepID=UPI002442E288|nr:metallophosphoesterase [Actinobacillus equuli]WGE81718.1 metallophosphoesterase [Actinobacillus equuli subsp. haemolyticus]